jgi:protein polybromo-1
VLEYNEYTNLRPTEIPEPEVYLCESVYDEFNKQIRKMQSPGGLKKFTHNQNVTIDEIYFFRRPITVQKVSESVEKFAN